jgi:hypothetical protein
LSRGAVSRRSGQGARGADPFSLRLREALGRFADGVHQLALPAASTALERARTAGLPASVLRVYQLADGIDLFGDLVRLRPLAAIEGIGDEHLLGEAEGQRLCCDAAGRIVELDDDDDRLCVAEDLETALLVYLAREALLVGADGEWKEVFGDDGELVAGVRRRRNEAALKRAPNASRWLVEAAELTLELDGDETTALKRCAEACAVDPRAAGAAELYGMLLESNGAHAEALHALATAAEQSGSTRRADRAAAAAEVARRVGDEAARARMAGLACAAEPGLPTRLGAEAEAALDGGRMEDADRLADLAAAVGGNEALPARIRGRARLRIRGAAQRG